MLRLDSSEMLPGSQKGEEKAGILKTQTQFRHFGSPDALYYGISMVGTGNDLREREHFCLISFEKCGETGYFIFIHGEVQDEVVNMLFASNFRRRQSTALAASWLTVMVEVGRDMRVGPYVSRPNSKVKLKSDIFCVVEVLWEHNMGSVMFYLLDMAHKRRQACPSVVVKEKQWSFSEKEPLGYGRTLIAYAGSGPPRHSTSTYDGPGGVLTILRS